MASLLNKNDETNLLWSENMWNNHSILCQDDTQPSIGNHGIFSSIYYVINSIRSLCLFQLSLILLVISATSYFLKPLGFPILSQMAGGVIVMGLIFPSSDPGTYFLLPDPVMYILRTISYFGLFLHTFMLGVETNMGALRRIGKKSITICFTGFGCSLLLSSFASNFVETYEPESFSSTTLRRLMLIQAQNFFGVTCSNVNDLGISNSELGRLASAIALVMDLFAMVFSTVLFKFIKAILVDDYWQPILIASELITVFFVLRPILLLVISYTPHGHAMSDTQFLSIIVLALVVSLLGALVDDYFVVYVFGLTIPQEPLSSFLAEKLDAFMTGIFFPIFCAIHGFQANFRSLKDFGLTASIELVLLTGHIGKFVGVFLSSIMFSIPWRNGLALAILITSKGFFDIILICIWREQELLDVREYTVASLHIFVTSFALLPVVTRLYKPSKHYATVFRQNMSESTKSGSLQTLACIYNEENVPGILHFLEALHPSRSNPIPMVTMQLLQLTGRCSLPIMAPFDQAKSYAALRGHIARCNRVVNAFSNLERKYKGYIRLQHYVSVASYATMHNDICNLAYEKNANLLILPFHAQWTAEGKIINYSQSIRDVNKMVFEKAPCSVASFINRGLDKDLIQLQLNLPNHVKYRVTIFFLGGPDDHEALAFCKFFANHPFITLTLLWLNSGEIKDKNTKDYQVIGRIIRENERRVDFKEVICDDASEMMKIMNTMKDEVDLVVVGKHHGHECAPLLGLDGEWNEYPELGVFADFLLTSHFNFSILVVQQEPLQDSTISYD
ncbi:hypothetical protein RND81_10G218200 [Saponaria officinalis]|uniref:Cation/H+ exchanger domain-containing protein n=1 Tax=Saponaria officinalis TaxID=3572 RepID=A0AAW1I7E1_SAPOF